MDEQDNSVRMTFRQACDEFTAYYAELKGQSPRAAAILTVTGLEDALETLIRSKFPDNISNTKWKRIAGPGPTPFGNMKAKIDVAEAFGFFGQDTRKTIERISQVRNKFAHKRSVRDFNHPDVLKTYRLLCDNPVASQTYNETPNAKDVRQNFIDIVEKLTHRLLQIRCYLPEVDRCPPEPLP